MDLILWRHAEAEDGRADLPDAKRRLTPKGERQSREMAKWLRARMPRNTRVVVSPSARTQQTAHALALRFEVDPRAGSESSTKDLIAVARWPEEAGAVLLVGHQPPLGRLVSLLLAGVEADWSIRKGGVWWLGHRRREGRDQAALRAVMNPDMLR